MNLLILMAMNSTVGRREVVNQEQTTYSTAMVSVGDSGGTEYRGGQSFQLSANKTVTAVEVYSGAGQNSPAGNWTVRIETDNAGVPSGTLADANASVVVVTPGKNTTVKATFATPFALTGSTTYWIVINCDDQANDNRWYLNGITSNAYANGIADSSANGTWGQTSPNNWDLYFKVYVQG